MPFRLLSKVWLLYDPFLQMISSHWRKTMILKQRLVAIHRFVSDWYVKYSWFIRYNVVHCSRTGPMVGSHKIRATRTDHLPADFLCGTDCSKGDEWFTFKLAREHNLVDFFTSLRSEHYQCLFLPHRVHTYVSRTHIQGCRCASYVVSVRYFHTYVIRIHAVPEVTR